MKAARCLVAVLLLVQSLAICAATPGGSGSIQPLTPEYIQRINADVHAYIKKSYTDVGVDPASPAYATEATIKAVGRALSFDRKNENRFDEVLAQIDELDKRSIEGYPDISLNTFTKRIWHHPTRMQEFLQIMQEAFVKRGVTMLPVNPADTSFSSLLIPIAKERITPNVFDLAPVRVVLGGDEIQPYDFYQVTDADSGKRMRYYGFVYSGVGVLNMVEIDRINDDYGLAPFSTRILALKHEMVHVELFRRYGVDGPSKWPLQEISDYLQSPFTLKAFQVEEILGDAATLVGAYENLYMTEYHAFDQTRPENFESYVYAGVAVTLIRAIEAAEKITRPDDPKAETIRRFLLESRPEDGSTPDIGLYYTTRSAMAEQFVEIAKHIARMIEQHR